MKFEMKLANCLTVNIKFIKDGKDGC